MLLNNYQADIIAIIQKYVNQGWILSFIFAVDARSDYVGFIQGSLEFVEGSRLFFKEYVDLQESIEKLSYSFHYQDRSNNLIFRYDNANHKPDLGYILPSHPRISVAARSAATLILGFYCLIFHWEGSRS